MTNEQTKKKRSVEEKILFICLTKEVKVKRNNLFHTYEMKDENKRI